MVRTFARRAAAAAVPLITLPVILLAAGTAQASAPAATITIQSQAQLLANGSVVVTVGYTCNPAFFGTTGSVFVDVQQNGRLGVASASALCDDQKHSVSLDVPGPFMLGTASAAAQIGSGISFATTNAELKVS